MSFIPEEDLNMERANRRLILALRFKQGEATQNFLSVQRKKGGKGKLVN